MRIKLAAPLLAPAVAAAALVGAAFAGGFVDTDQRFADAAAQAGLAEVKTSRLVSDRSRDDDVRAFADRMIKEHTKIAEDLQAIAKKKGAKLPSGLNDVQKANYQRLEKLKGEEFDRQYARVMLGDHETAVDLFQNKGAKATDDDLKKFASRTLPVLKHHLGECQTLAKKLGVIQTPSPPTEGP